MTETSDGKNQAGSHVDATDNRVAEQMAVNETAIERLKSSSGVGNPQDVA